MTSRKRQLGRVCLVTALILSPVVAWRVWIAHEVNRQLAAIRAKGFPTNGKELNDWYTAVTDDQNAALFLTKAFELRRNYSDSRSNLILRFKLPDRRYPLTADQTELLGEYVAMNGPMVALAEESLKRPASRYPIDCTKLMDTELPHLAWLKGLAGIHQYAAILSLQSGNSAGAASNIVTILALARTLDTEPTLISQLVRLSLVKMAYITFERRANTGRFEPAELDQLSTAFVSTQMSNVAARALVGERAMVIPYFRMTRAEMAKLRPPQNGNNSASESPLPYNGPTILRVLGYYELDFGSYLYAMDRGIGLAERPPPANLAASRYFAHVAEESTKRNRTLTGVILTPYAGVAFRENEGIAHQRLAVTALAVEQFRNQNGRLPETLSEVAPRFLPAVPEDPFQGTPLHYHQLPRGYVIYSVGRDGNDDGGREKPQSGGGFVPETIPVPAPPSTSEKRGASSNGLASGVVPGQVTNGVTYDLTFTVER